MQSWQRWDTMCTRVAREEKRGYTGVKSQHSTNIRPASCAFYRRCLAHPGMLLGAVRM